MQLFFKLSRASWKTSPQVVLNLKFDLLDVSPASISLQLAKKTPWALSQSQFTLCEMQHSRRREAITISLS